MKYFKPLLLLFCLATLCCCKDSGKDKFSYKLIPVETDGKWGYIDKSGKYIINPQFKDACLFTDGIALVHSQDDKFGYINEEGKYLINPIYVFAGNFSEGYAFVSAANGVPACIDKEGKIKFSLKDVSTVYSFTEGLACVVIDDKYGFIDKTGKLVINAIYDEANPFSEGLAMVATRGQDGNYHWGYINTEGKLVINQQFDAVSDFSEGMAAVSSGTKHGYIDKKGAYIINPQFDAAGDFSEGMAEVKQGDSWGFIDKTGKFVINPQFNMVLSFKNGLAAVRSGKENWGYVDKKGKYVINPQFKAASNFYDDFAFTMTGDKIGLIDKNGKYLANPQFENTFANYYAFLGFFFDAPYIITRSDYSDPKQTAKTFLYGYYHLDYDAAKKVATEETKKTLDMMKQLSATFFPDSMKRTAKDIAVSIVDVKENGDNASVTYHTSTVPGDQSLHLVKDKGKWMVQWTKEDQMNSKDAAGVIPPPEPAPTR